MGNIRTSVDNIAITRSVIEHLHTTDGTGKDVHLDPGKQLLRQGDQVVCRCGHGRCVIRYAWFNPYNSSPPLTLRTLLLHLA